MSKDPGEGAEGQEVQQVAVYRGREGRGHRKSLAGRDGAPGEGDRGTHRCFGSKGNPGVRSPFPEPGAPPDQPYTDPAQPALKHLSQQMQQQSHQSSHQCPIDPHILQVPANLQLQPPRRLGPIPP